MGLHQVSLGWRLLSDCWVLQGQQAAKSGIDAAHGQAKAGADQAADTVASQVCLALCLGPSACTSMLW